jgi:hypothetical protein
LSALDAVSHGEHGEGEQDRAGETGGHLDVGADGGEGLACRAEDDRVQRDEDGLVDPGRNVLVSCEAR